MKTLTGDKSRPTGTRHTVCKDFAIRRWSIKQNANKEIEISIYHFDKKSKKKKKLHKRMMLTKV